MEKASIQNGQDEFVRYLEPIITRDDVTSEMVTEFYSKVTDLYAKAHDNGREDFYLGPMQVAEGAEKYLGENTSARILDAACGTGRVAQELRMKGFTNIDGVDPCRDMLTVAQKDKLYQSTYCCFLHETGDNTPSNGSYDLVGCAGGFVPGHIPPEGIKDMLAYLKPGGILVNAMREAYLEHPFYKDKLLGAINDLQENKCMEVIELRRTEEYFNGLSGMFMVFRKL